MFYSSFATHSAIATRISGCTRASAVSSWGHISFKNICRTLKVFPPFLPQNTEPKARISVCSVAALTMALMHSHKKSGLPTLFSKSCNVGAPTGATSLQFCREAREKEPNSFIHSHRACHVAARKQKYGGIFIFISSGNSLIGTQSFVSMQASICMHLSAPN